LSMYRWMWPWSGRMSVVVALTMVALARSMTMWTVGPLTDCPLVGDTTVRVALDDGRGPADANADGPAEAAVGALEVVAADGDGAQADNSAARDTRTSLDRLRIGFLIGRG
jgi:hypothetical protein